MYITHLTHGAGARPSKTQAPTATRLTTPKADQGRHREEQADPPPKKKGGGGHETGRQPQNRPPTPQEAAKHPSPTTPRTGLPEGTPEDRPAKTGDTKPRAVAHRKKGHHEHADTQHAEEETEGKKTKNTRRRSPNERGRGNGDHETHKRDSHRPTPQSHDTRRHDAPPAKKIKGEAGGKPHLRQHLHIPRHRPPPRR